MNDINNASFGIVILNYNTFEDVANSLENLKKMDLASHPVVIVDSYSTNKTGIDRVRELMRPIDHLVLLESNVGYAKGNNIGIKILKEQGYEYSYIFNPDVDFSNLNFYDVISSAIDLKATIIDSVVNGSRYIYKRGSPISMLYSSNKILSSKEGIQKNYRFNGCAFLANNENFLSLGGFDESTFLYGEELIFSEKCYQSNMIIVSHDKFIVEHSFGGSVRKYFRLRKYKHIYYGLFIYLTKYRNVNNLSSSLIAFLNATRQMFINIIKRNF